MIVYKLVQHCAQAILRHVSMAVTTIFREENTTDQTNTTVRRCVSYHAHIAVVLSSLKVVVAVTKHVAI